MRNQKLSYNIWKLSSGRNDLFNGQLEDGRQCPRVLPAGRAAVAGFLTGSQRPAQATSHYGAMCNTNKPALSQCLSHGTERSVPAHQRLWEQTRLSTAAALGSCPHPSCLPHSTLGLLFSQQPYDNPTPSHPPPPSTSIGNVAVATAAATSPLPGHPFPLSLKPHHTPFFLQQQQSHNK
ncbi:hypothetical protein SRHO_G00064770 [Serrasalmus rhombeus]